MSDLKKHVYKLVDDWLELGDLDERPIEGVSEFEQWVERKIKAGNELSSFAEEVIDELLGQFKGNKDLVGKKLDEVRADAWDAVLKRLHDESVINYYDHEHYVKSNPYRKQEEA